jgi:parvulin-like peptidyl-prolyl isomerase
MRMIPDGSKGQRGGLPVALISLCLILVFIIGVPLRAEAVSTKSTAPTDTLVWVNSVPILGSDLDRLLRETHAKMSQEGMENFDPHKLLTKSINDELLLQQAEALGLEQEPEIEVSLRETKRKEASSLWVRDHFHRPEKVSQAEIRRSYAVNFERIQLRQISLRTKAKAEELRKMVLAGASMDSLARSLSLDTKRLEGGLYKELPLMEVSAIPLRAARNLKQGELSSVFPINDAWAFVRMEKRQAAPQSGFEAAKPTLEKMLLKHHRKLAWRAFVDSLEAEIPVRQNAEVMTKIRADSTVRFTAEFMKGSDAPALLLGPDEFVSDYELRQEISHEIMNDGTAPFETALKRALDSKTESLLLDHLAKRDGYAERKEVMQAYENARRKTLIQNYLNEAVVSKIKFSHEEFNEFYQKNKEKWRGPDQVRLDIVVIADDDQARELQKRLNAGADFERVISDYPLASETRAGEHSWTSLESFSEQMQSELASMKINDVSQPLKISQGWLFCRLVGRRPGKIPSLEEMDRTIRSVMFQKKFREILDEHLALLKNRSTIVRNQPAIDAYFSQGS